ncbi:MAG: hypothetical protein NTU73_01995 [Ignavibacteriae bacterium]|nr:hypothetical protein [Ignavibacteriota bacterium]
MQGYIKLYRQITENEFYFSERFTKVQAWIDLLILANHKPNTIFIRGIEIKTVAGELCYSQLTLAKRWKWNFKTVNKFLLMLENRKMITIKINKVTTIITILNWKQYQGNGEQNGEQKENKTETNKNVKECKEIINPKNNIPMDTKNKEKNYLYSVVKILMLITSKEKSNCFALVQRLLKYKAEDNLTYLQKCLILMYIIKANQDTIKKEKYIGILTNQYRELSYSDFKNLLFQNSEAIKKEKYEILN